MKQETPFIVDEEHKDGLAPEDKEMVDRGQGSEYSELFTEEGVDYGEEDYGKQSLDGHEGEESEEGNQHG
jgi:hypothetical protein